MLRATQQPHNDFRHQLAGQLEVNFHNVSMQSTLTSQYVEPQVEDQLSWSIFDDMSIRFVNQRF